MRQKGRVEEGRISGPSYPLKVRFTDRQSYFVSEASVYRLLKAHDLIASQIGRAHV